MNEDYVSFDLAKKLKEKGYPQRTFGKYDMQGACYIEDGRFYENGCLTEVERAYTAPTISQVLKWLREEKKLHIELWTVGKKPIKWCHTITTLNHVGEKQGWSSGERGDSYEAAAIAGIEYALDNLLR